MGGIARPTSQTCSIRDVLVEVHLDRWQVKTLLEEATEIKWSFLSNGRIIIEPKEDIKERLGYSPDEFDALANTFHPSAVRYASEYYEDEFADDDEDILY